MKEQKTGICNKCENLSSIGGLTYPIEYICSKKFWRDEHPVIKEEVKECNEFEPRKS